MPRTILGADSYKDKDLSELIYIYKRRAGYTHQQCADAVGISEPTWRKYAKTPSVMPLQTLRKVQKKLNIPVSKMQEFLL